MLICVHFYISLLDERDPSAPQQEPAAGHQIGLDGTTEPGVM